MIYALNTKNDEHEAAIATLKEAHEEEVQQILSDTREKILQVCVFWVVFRVNIKGDQMAKIEDGLYTDPFIID